jgi:hypothetical protein
MYDCQSELRCGLSFGYQFSDLSFDWSWLEAPPPCYLLVYRVHAAPLLQLPDLSKMLAASPVAARSIP